MPFTLQKFSIFIFPLKKTIKLFSEDNQNFDIW